MSEHGASVIFTGKYVTVSSLPLEWGAKTFRYKVQTKEGLMIAIIQWYGRWRKYALFPMEQTVWEPTCLREMAMLVEQLTKAQRQSHPTKGAFHAASAGSRDAL